MYIYVEIDKIMCKKYKNSFMSLVSLEESVIFHRLMHLKSLEWSFRVGKWSDFSKTRKHKNAKINIIFL